MKPLLLLAFAPLAFGAPLPIAPLDRSTPVDFEQEVAPFLQDNCFSCHCKTTTKGGLNLETPELMLKGGDTGPGLKPGNAADSLVLQAATHLDDDLKMPPRDNKAKAKNLTPVQLALLKLWIDQGAKPSPKREKVIAWQPLPQNLGAIFAVAVTPDGQFAACGRANQIGFYHLPSGRLLSSEVAHRDQVNALAASPDGTLIASGGYREVKLWRRVVEGGRPAKSLAAPSDASARVDGKSLVLRDAAGKQIAQVEHGEGIVAFAVRGDRKAFATAGGNFAKLWSADGKLIAELRGNRETREHVEACDRALQVAAR
ncbi:MAG: c-type cytochrome domain-containing protein, partial [Chthoniobacteraceae bacterium]